MEENSERRLVLHKNNELKVIILEGYGVNPTPSSDAKHLENAGLVDVHEGMILTEADARSLINGINRFLDVDGSADRLFTTVEERHELKLKLCREFKVADTQDLHEKTRKKEVVVARQLFFYMMIVDGYGSLSAIGRIFDKDHATVLHSKKVINDYIFTKDDRFFRAISNVVLYYGLGKRFGITYLKEEKNEI